VALIGDAASTSDPAFGQGMALALRDVAVLTKSLLETDDSEEAGYSYARQNSSYSAANRFVSGVLREAQFHEGACADQLRSSALWRKHAGRLRAAQLDGPDDTFGDLLATIDGRLGAARTDERTGIAC
jgi:2-polyprenyl-6-methoxyphenol hydroxylase-like FAD-dependent oxidoreductase